MRRPLFWKVLLGFWVAFALTVEALYLIFIVLRPQPSDTTRALSRISMASAVSAIRSGGEPLLHQVLTGWPKDIRGRLTVEPWRPDSVILTNIDTGAISQKARSPAGKDYLVTYTVKLFAGYGHGPFDFPQGIGMLAIIGGLGFSALLAWYLTRPILRFRQGFGRLAAGDFSTRLSPRMAGGKDEIADLARDFDAMAIHLEQLVTARDKLLSDVSHELRSPLARLQLAIGLARQDPARLPSSLDRIGLEAHRLDELVGELLTLSKLESPAGRSEDYFDLASVVASVADDARFEASDKDVRIVQTGSAEELLVAGSGKLMSRAVENIVRNALRFSPPGKAVSISTAREDGIYTVRIEDEGPGVPAEVLPTLFRAFAKGASDGQGFGLGLTIAQRAVTAHGGQLAAQNRACGGLSIAITLPAATFHSA